MRILCLLFLLSGLSTLTAQDRNPVYWPFTAESIWNKPIGSAADYQPANLGPAGHVGIDVNHLPIIDSTFRDYPVYDSPTWGPGRCSGTTNLGFTFPAAPDWTVPDAGNSPYGGTPNGNFALIDPENGRVWQGNKVSRCEPDGPVYLPDWTKWPDNRSWTSLYSDGLDGRGQGATGLSSLGGTIRLGELTGNTPIRHVIKINPWAEKYCHYSEELPGYVWPAKRADGYAAERYNRQGDPLVTMGSLFAIPPNVTVEALNLQTEAGRKLFFTLQNYGTYFTEDAAWDTWDLVVERGVGVEFEATFGYSMSSDTWRAEVNKLMQALRVIANNKPNSIGGGGEPLQPLAPALDRTTSVMDSGLPQLRVIPNPVREQITIAGGSASTAWQLYQLDGKLLQTGKGTDIDVRTLAAGAYLLRLKDGRTVSIIKQE